MKQPLAIVRRIDELGRIAIPREFCHKLKMKKDQPLAIYLTEHGLVMEMYDDSNEKKE